MTSMALAIGSRRSARSMQLGAAAGVAACLGGLLVFALLSSPSKGGSTGDLAARQSAVTTWEDTVHPLVAQGGEVVALGPRTAVGALAQHTVTVADMRAKATGWVQRLTALRQQIAAVDTPSSLRTAHDLLDTAMAGYVTASRDVLDATTASGARRTQLLDDAAAAGKAADSQYDKAAAAIAALRAELDLPTDWSGT